MDLRDVVDLIIRLKLKENGIHLDLESIYGTYENKEEYIITYQGQLTIKKECLK